MTVGPHQATETRTLDYLENAKGTVLLVEDDSSAAQVLRDVLESSGYRVSHAENGAEARAMMEQATPDLVVLDLGLPDEDGLILCSKLKAIADVPIIICSASDKKRERVLGLKLGADDFIGKPFDLDEFEARVQAVLRRSAYAKHPDESEEMRIGELAIDLDGRRVTLGGQLIQLTPTEYRLLSTLASRHGHIFSREDLARLVWGSEDVSSGRTIDVHIQRLRSKLGPAPAPPITSVRGFGYRIEAEASAPAGASDRGGQHAP